MSNICVIPARGGSKRIPGKNIKDFLGEPIIAYSIKAALKSGLFDEVMVSTDDEGIAKIALQLGATVPCMRSKKNSDDDATLSDVINEVKEIFNLDKKRFDNICCLLPTSPFVTVDLLFETLRKLEESGADSIRPIVKFSYPIQRALKIDCNDIISFYYPEYTYTKSQDLVEAYHDAGMFYWMKFDKGLNGSIKKGFIISENLCHDIDTEEDWKIAELKYKNLHNYE